MKNFTLLSNSNNYISTCEDPFNLQRQRNIYNQREKDFNCGGYALETYSWFCPLISKSDLVAKKLIDEGFEPEDIDLDYIDYSLYQEDINKEFEDICKAAYRVNLKYNLNLDKKEVKRIMKDTYFFKDIYSSDLILFYCVQNMLEFFPDLRLVNNRKEVKSDEYLIAFAIGNGDFHFARIDSNIITHKRGGCEIETVKSLEEVFKSRYDSEIILFAKKFKELEK